MRLAFGDTAIEEGTRGEGGSILVCEGNSASEYVYGWPGEKAELGRRGDESPMMIDRAPGGEEAQALISNALMAARRDERAELIAECGFSRKKLARHTPRRNLLPPSGRKRNIASIVSAVG